MASATLFLALQCVQCATMQVKHQKKSSNKWVCAVCNQRQSVLRVHARGYRAADLRHFVQDANLARGRREFAALAEPEEGWDSPEVEEQGDELLTEKKRTDWSEYMDDPGEQRDGYGGVDVDASDGGIEVITELPEERPKVRRRKAQSGAAGKRSKSPIGPTLSKRQHIEQGSSPCCATTTITEEERPKWSKYLDASFFEERNGPESSGLHWTDLGEGATTEVVVEDEVHPDFL